MNILPIKNIDRDESWSAVTHRAFDGIMHIFAYAAVGFVVWRFVGFLLDISEETDFSIFSETPKTFEQPAEINLVKIDNFSLISLPGLFGISL